jgi:hypothetical protein
MASRLKYSTTRPDGCDGLNDNERRVLDLWDAYVPVDLIVERTGLSRGFVMQVVSEFSVTAHEPWKVDARRGSAMLADALARHFPQLCGGAA